MTIPTHVFREDDIRGLVATELTPPFAEALGRGYGDYLLEHNHGAQSVVLGRDHRLSSTGLARAFSAGVRSRGLDVVDVGVVPTPLTYFAANVLPVDGLCMITGSHNPPEYNGFKIGLGKTTLAGPEVQALKERVLALDRSPPPPARRPGVETSFDIYPLYLHTTLSLRFAVPSVCVMVCR